MLRYFTRCHTLLLVIWPRQILCMLLLGISSMLHAAAPPIAVMDVQPVDDLGDILVERTEGEFDGDPDGWRINVDFWLKNTMIPNQSLEKVIISYSGGSNPGGTIVNVDIYNLLTGRGVIPKDDDAGLAANEIPAFLTRVAFIPEQRVLPFPLPDEVTVELFFEGYDEPVVVTRPLREFVSRAFLDSFAFPGGRKDLLPDEYWYVGKSHTYQSHHRLSTRQRFAEDWGIRRWDPADSRWTSLRDGGVISNNADHLIWNKPIYAIADGEIIRCANGFPDNPNPPNKLPGVTSNPPEITPGGNLLWIEHVTGEVVLYAHFREGTLPGSLCREDSSLWVQDVNPPIPVVAGEFLGRVGNSGNSTGPHLHIHTEGRDSQIGYPHYYHNADSFGESTYDPDIDASPPWNEVIDAAISSHQVQLNPLISEGAFARPGRRSNLGIAQTLITRPAIAGLPWSAGFDLTNHGPDATPGVTLVHVLPSELAHVSDTGSCVEGPIDTLTCDIGTLAGLGPSGEEAHWSVDVTAMVPADLVYNNGGPLSLVSGAYVEGANFDDSAPNNVTFRDVLVVAQSDLSLESLQAISAPEELLVGGSAEATVEAEVRSGGPSSPIDARLYWVNNGAGTPSSADVTLPAMTVGEQRTAQGTFTLDCEASGEQTFNLGARVLRANPEDWDSDFENNSMSVMLDVECVLPVAINIKPGGTPNSVKHGKGIVTVAILSTEAGEYGLPEAVDATAIDPLSLRFGDSDLVWTAAGGATERHNDGHLMNVNELDEATVDDDLDLVLHFNSDETGLIPTATEACVKGTIEIGGAPYTFFGCDAVNMID